MCFFTASSAFRSAATGHRRFLKKSMAVSVSSSQQHGSGSMASRTVRPVRSSSRCRLTAAAVRFSAHGGVKIGRRVQARKTERQGRDASLDSLGQETREDAGGRRSEFEPRPLGPARLVDVLLHARAVEIAERERVERVTREPAAREARGERGGRRGPTIEFLCRPSRPATSRAASGLPKRAAIFTV